MNGSKQRAYRRAAILVTAAVLLAALGPAFAWAEPMATARPFVVSGFGRYGTAVAVADYGVTGGLGSYGFVGIATGQNFPDALCGGAAVGSRSGVILMTPKEALNGLTEKKLRDNGPALREVQVYGSEAAVSKAAWDSIVAAVR